jgi:hypothetical protein
MSPSRYEDGCQGTLDQCELLLLSEGSEIPFCFTVPLLWTLKEIHFALFQNTSLYLSIDIFIYTFTSQEEPGVMS